LKELKTYVLDAAIANMQTQAAGFWLIDPYIPTGSITTSDVIDVGAKINAIVGAIAPFIKGTLGYLDIPGPLTATSELQTNRSGTL
jgi:hypothetical protein